MGLKESIINLVSPQRDANVNIYSASNTLASEEKGVVYDSNKPLSKKTTPILNRIPKQSLEIVYLTEPNIFNAINKTAQLIMSAGYSLIGDERSVTFFNNFFEGIGSYGGELEWTELLSAVFRHQMIYGEAWNELIPAKKDITRIVDLDIIDPKKMDYAKDGSDRIILDSYQNPVGYIETLPYDYNAEGVHEPAVGVDLENNQVFFPPEKIAHYKLYTVGDLFYGVGLIEPCYDTAVRKIDMEKALANSVKRTGFPLRYAEIGDLNHEPTDEVMQRTVEKLRGLDYKDVIAYPYWVKSGIVEARSPEKLQDHLNYYTDEISTCMGMPKAIVTGAGEATNRSTLNRQESVAKQTLKDIVERTIRVINKKVIVPVAESNKVNPVRIVWGEINIEELDGKSKRLKSYVDAGLITPDTDIEDFIRKYEDLPRRMKNARKITGTKPDGKSPEQEEDK